MSSRFFHPYSSNGLYFEQLGQSHSGTPSRSPSGSGSATGIIGSSILSYASSSNCVWKILDGSKLDRWMKTGLHSKSPVLIDECYRDSQTLSVSVKQCRA